VNFYTLLLCNLSRFKVTICKLGTNIFALKYESREFHMKTLALGQENGQLNLLAGLTFSDADGLSILATILHHLFIYT